MLGQNYIRYIVFGGFTLNRFHLKYEVKDVAKEIDFLVLVRSQRRAVDMYTTGS